jgi:hypothetical protein
VSVGESPSLDTGIPHPARVYDYWLGGKDNFAADRETGDQIVATQPSVLPAVRANRAFLRRAVQFLAREAGVRQFLDIGTGLPTNENTHQIAQGVAPEARVVYVDNDPIVLVHARRLLEGSAEGATTYIEADARDPEGILREAGRTLDLRQPVGVMMLAVMHFVPDADDPPGIVARVMDGVAAGSYLTLSEATRDVDTERITQAAGAFNEQRVAARFVPRTRAEIMRYFEGLELVEPGLVPLPEWRGAGKVKEWIPAYGGVARKPTRRHAGRRPRRRPASTPGPGPG